MSSSFWDTTAAAVCPWRNHTEANRARGTSSAQMASLGQHRLHGCARPWEEELALQGDVYVQMGSPCGMPVLAAGHLSGCSVLLGGPTLYILSDSRQFWSRHLGRAWGAVVSPCVGNFISGQNMCPLQMLCMEQIFLSGVCGFCDSIFAFHLVLCSFMVQPQCSWKETI